MSKFVKELAVRSKRDEIEIYSLLRLGAWLGIEEDRCRVQVETLSCRQINELLALEIKVTPESNYYILDWLIKDKEGNNG